jgi:hypothetical protein
MQIDRPSSPPQLGVTEPEDGSGSQTERPKNQKNTAIRHAWLLEPKRLSKGLEGNHPTKGPSMENVVGGKAMSGSQP